MVLSGGVLAPALFEEVFALADTNAPQFAIDASPCVTQASLDAKRAAWKVYSEMYDFPEPLWLQDYVDDSLSKGRVAASLDRADVLYVSGGASRKAIEQWHEARVVSDIVDRVDEGSLVAAGGSAGAMIWFDVGLSDSDSYYAKNDQPWEYRAVEETGMFGAWVMAHYADKDAFGRSKQELFDQFLSEQEGAWEYAVGIDTYAALVCAAGLARVRNLTPPSRADWGLSAQVALYSHESANVTRLSDGDTIPLSDL